MHVWRDVLWSSFTEELTKIARANAVAKTMRVARPRPQLKIKPPMSANPATGYTSSFVTKPMGVQPSMHPAVPSGTMQAPSLQATGAGPVTSMPTNMSSPLTSGAGIPTNMRNPSSMPTNIRNPLTSGSIPARQSSGPMNNIGKY